MVMDVRLVYFGANGRRREVHLHNGIVSVGRGDTCQLRIPADTVSRRHCEIEVMPTGVVLTDLGSSNGTLVNGQQIIDDDLDLKAGDKVTIGPATFIIQIDGEPASIAAPQPAEPDGEEALTGSSVADDSFDPFSALEDLAGAADEEEEEEDIPKGPKIAQIKRPPPEPKEGSAGARKGPDKPGPK